MSDEKVVSLAQFKADQEPTADGPARCLSCQHEWWVTVPLPFRPGHTPLECPSCHRETGVLRYRFERDLPVWTCDCGSDVFLANEDGLYCAACGTFHGFNPWED